MPYQRHCTWRYGLAGRFCWRARPASARPRWPRLWPDALDRNLIRLQCYEGLDIHQAVYEWNYARQVLEIQLMRDGGQLDRSAAAKELFRREFLIERPLLRALEHDGPAPVLLIDELDRADEEFEGYLLEMLSDFQVTIPELGTVRASKPPIILITSNRTRELHDALKRRCVYCWIDYPGFAKELRIVETKVPGAAGTLGEQATAFVQELRQADLYKKAGVSETLDWVTALVALNDNQITPERIDETLGILLKNQEDIQTVRGEPVRAMLDRARHRGCSDQLRRARADQRMGHLLENLTSFARLLRSLGIAGADPAARSKPRGRAPVHRHRQEGRLPARTSGDPREPGGRPATVRPCFPCVLERALRNEHQAGFAAARQRTPLRRTLRRNGIAVTRDRFRRVGREGRESSVSKLQPTANGKSCARRTSRTSPPKRRPQAVRLLREMRWRPEQRKTKRWMAGRGASADLRRLLARFAWREADPTPPPTRLRRTAPRHLVLLCDISGSMERYTRMLLWFACCLTGNLRRVESFVFATRLTRITKKLKGHRGKQPIARNRTDRARLVRWHLHRGRPARLQHAMGATDSPERSGRTRGFGRLGPRRSRSAGPGDCAVAAVMSPLDLASARCWETPRYEPLTRGLQAALPYVDDFLPVHNLASLDRLAVHLNTLPG